MVPDSKSYKVRTPRRLLQYLDINLTVFRTKLAQSYICFRNNMPSESVPLHKLGKNGPSVPALGFGLMGLSHDTYGTIPSDDERFAILDRAYELGSTFWDSSE
jgi:hypothetical protein